nr:sulfatase-like hydrolase/transferase [Caldilineaceae bacterium]
VAPQQYFDLYDPEKLTLPTFPPEVDSQRGPDNYDDAELRLARQGYYGQISEVDHQTGRMLAALDELGIAEETIVVFTSDHGEWLGEHLKYGKSYPAHDQCSRVPLIVRWPGQIAAGRALHGLTEAVDVLPTLLECIGAQIPPHLQGVSLWQNLLGDDTPVKESALTEHTGWKSLRTDRFRYVRHTDGREMLYDLAAEWGDYRDVSADNGYTNELTEARHALLQKLLPMERPLARVWPY